VLAEAGPYGCWCSKPAPISAHPQALSAVSRSNSPAPGLSKPQQRSATGLQAQHPGYWKTNPDLYVDEAPEPLHTTPEARPFVWRPGRQVGGPASLTWGRDHPAASELPSSRRPCPRWPRPLLAIENPRPWRPIYRRLERLLGVHGQRDAGPSFLMGSFCALPYTAGGAGTMGQAIGKDPRPSPWIHSPWVRLGKPRTMAQQALGPPSSFPRPVPLGRALAQPAG